MNDLKHQKEKRHMDHFAGLDVSVKETSVCILDETGRILREVMVASEPDVLLQVLAEPTYRLKRVGLEAGPLSQRLFSALGEAGLPVMSRRGTCGQCCRRRSTRPTATTRVAWHG